MCVLIVCSFVLFFFSPCLFALLHVWLLACSFVHLCILFVCCVCLFDCFACLCGLSVFFGLFVCLLVRSFVCLVCLLACSVRLIVFFALFGLSVYLFALSCLYCLFG